MLPVGVNVPADCAFAIGARLASPKKSRGRRKPAFMFHLRISLPPPRSRPPGCWLGHRLAEPRAHTLPAARNGRYPPRRLQGQGPYRARASVPGPESAAEGPLRWSKSRTAGREVELGQQYSTAQWLQEVFLFSLCFPLTLSPLPGAARSGGRQDVAPRCRGAALSTARPIAEPTGSSHRSRTGGGSPRSDCPPAATIGCLSNRGPGNRAACRRGTESCWCS